MTTKTNFKKGEPFKPLEEGDYLVRMTNCELLPTKKGGKMVKACFQVVKGKTDADKNRLVFENFVVEHESKRVVEISNKRLDFYLKAVGEPDGIEGIAHDYSRLSNYLETPFIATLKVKEGNEYVKDGKTIKGNDHNTIFAFKAR